MSNRHTIAANSTAFNLLDIGHISWLILISPIADVLTGAVMLFNIPVPFSASVILKGYILVIALIALLTRFPQKWAIYTVVVLEVSALSFVFLHFTSKANVTLYNMQWWIKLITPFVLILLYAEFLKRDYQRTHCWIEKILHFYRYFFPISIIVPEMFGIGFNTYEYGIGGKGLYYAGNDISIVMAVMAILNMHEMQKSFTKKNVLVAIATIGVLFYLGTKTGMLMGVVVVLVFFARNRNRTVFFSIVGGVIAAIIAAAVFFKDSIVTMIASQLFLYNRFMAQTSSVISFLTSGRNDMLRRSFEELAGQSDKFFTILFGEGVFRQRWKFWDFGSTEMDFFDLFFWNGILVTLVVMIAILGFVIAQVRTASFPLKFSFYAMIVFSFFWGHVLFAPMPNFVLAAICMAIVDENLVKKRKQT